MKNFNKLSIAFLLFITLFSFGFSGKCGIKEFDKNRPAQEKAEIYAKLPLEMPYYESLTVYKTPKGATVATQDAIPAEQQSGTLEAVDAAINRVKTEASELGWKFGQTHSEYYVAMIRPTYRTTEGLYTGSGALTMRDTLTVTGTVLEIKLDKKQVMYVSVVAQNFDNPQATKLFVRNEIQHNMTMMNDWNMHVGNAGRGNDVHPLPQMSRPDENDWIAAPLVPETNLVGRIIKFGKSLTNN